METTIRPKIVFEHVNYYTSSLTNIIIIIMTKTYLLNTFLVKFLLFYDSFFESSYSLRLISVVQLYKEKKNNISLQPLI